MAMKMTLTLQGGKELERKLKTLPTRIRNKVVRTALRSGAKLVQAETKQLAPVATGLLRKSLKVRAMKRKKGRIGINVQMGAGDYKGETFYGAFVEYGHKVGKRPGKLDKAADSRGSVAGKHFMDEAFENKAQDAADLIESQLKAGIEAEAARG